MDGSIGYGEHQDSRGGSRADGGTRARRIADQRNAVLIGGTGTGKTHVAIAIDRECVT
jgi:DNA replication protein DnaC